jgi:hypothetical protein
MIEPKTRKEWRRLYKLFAGILAKKLHVRVADVAAAADPRELVIRRGRRPNRDKLLNFANKILRLRAMPLAATVIGGRHVG